MTTASATPRGNQRVVSTRRGPLISSATGNTAIRLLFSSATPRMAPAPSHHRGSPPRRIRAPTQHTATHASRSMVVVLSRCATPRSTPATVMQAAASSCSARLPPSSRAIMPLSRTTPAAISADGRRSATSESGATLPTSRAKAGASGG